MNSKARRSRTVVPYDTERTKPSLVKNGGEITDVPDKVSEIWETPTESEVIGMAWDSKDPGWWIRSGGLSLKENCLLKINTAGKIVATISNNIPQNNASICMDRTSDNIVLIDWETGSIHVLSKTGELINEMKSVVDKQGASGIAYCQHRDMYVISDYREHCLMYVDGRTGKPTQKIGEKGVGDYKFNNPFDICHGGYNKKKCEIYVSDWNNVVKVYTPHGKFVRAFGSQMELNHPRGVCADPRGGVFVCDYGNLRIVRISLNKKSKNEVAEVIIDRVALRDRRPYTVSVCAERKFLIVGLSKSIMGFKLQQ